MDWITSLAVLLGLLIVALGIGLPVAFAFIGISIAGLVYFLGPDALSLLANATFSSVAQFVYVPVPLFVLMGELLLRSGIATMALDAADHWIGRVPARLSVSAVGGGTVFASVSGSSMASVAMLGASIVPEMTRRKYKPAMALGPVLAAGGLAVLIPPSSLAVLLGALAKVSVSKLLIAIIVPGLILAAVYMCYFIGRAVLQPQVAPAYDATKSTWADRLRTLKLLVPLSSLIIVVTGFIFFGIATPSEAAAMGAIAAALIALAFNRLSWRVIGEALSATAAISCMVLLIIAGSTAYSQVLATTGATTKLVQLVGGLDLSPIIMVICMQVVIFLLGCFIDAVSIMLITLPIFMPIIGILGIDPVWFCVLMLIQLEIGGITPPFGLMLFVLKGVRPEMATKEVYAAAVPIVLMQFMVIGLLMAFPGLATGLSAVMRW